MSADPLVNQEMEAVLIGGVLAIPKLAGEAAFIDADDFAYDLHRILWSEMQRRMTAGQSLAPLALAQSLRDELEPHGGVGFINRLVSLVIANPSVAAWAQEVKSLSTRRKVMAILDDRKELIADVGLAAGPEETIADLIADLEKITARSSPRFKTAREVRYEEVENMKRPVVCYSTGFHCLDDAMAGGLHAGKAYGLFARMKAGKTLLAGQIAQNLNHAGTKSAYICGEMGPNEIEHRNMAQEIGVNALAMIDNRWRSTPSFVSRVGTAAVQSPESLFYLDAPGLTFDQLRRDVTHAIVALGVKGFVLDYLQLVGGKRKGQTTAEHLDEISQWIAEVVRKRKVFALVLGQMNQEGNTRGGEGVRLAFDQVYELRRQANDGPGAWLEMIVTRYTKWANVGTEIVPALYLDQKVGPRFTEGQGSMAA